MSKTPSTSATRLLKQLGVPYAEHLYRYEDRGGTSASARELGLSEHAVIKTLVMEDEKGTPMIVLMHGDLEVGTQALARQIGAKSVQSCRPETALRHSGYMVGGTSPFGTKKSMPLYAEASIFDLERIYINGGSRGFLVEMDPRELEKVLTVVRVKVALG